MVFASGALTLLLCIGIGQLRSHEPVPEVHDEHAYVLAGDTFAQGRLTTPPHPLWRSFETFHVLQHPTIQAKYPPGQGLFLALGIVLTGRPIVGVWISAALFVSALCWMLQAWTTPRWAVVGTLVGMMTMVLGGHQLQGGQAAYWSQTYWGGCVAGLGGALVLGGFRRVVASGGWWPSVLMGFGAVVAAMSRPFEGLMLCLPLGVALVVWLCRVGTGGFGTKLVRGIVPAAAVAAIGLAWIGSYTAHVTGSAFDLPHVVYHKQYCIMPLFRWQAPYDLPPGLNAPMRSYALWEEQAGYTLSRPLRRLCDNGRLLAFEVGPYIAVAMGAMAAWTLRGRWMLLAAGVLIWVLGAMFSISYYEAHYHAPAAGLTLILGTETLRRVGVLRVGRRRLGGVLAAAVVVATAGRCAWQWFDTVRTPERLLEHWSLRRELLNTTLARQGGQHVVFVRYGPRHNHDIELVYNRADIDASPVVWVRELDGEQNEKVREYYKGRQMWLFDMPEDQRPETLTPVSP